jgi:selenocysteine-specific elongation factor
MQKNFPLSASSDSVKRPTELVWQALTFPPLYLSIGERCESSTKDAGETMVMKRMPERSQRCIVIGTAGHIDHGKTSLVRALTGVDTDRLPEEKKRGISIDLGFAHMALPNGSSISFVDVPGHERFVKNMLAGVSGIQAVLLVVAADEGVEPQTREHFNICRLLGLRQGFVVLTKSDIADVGQIRAARVGVEELCRGSFLDGAPIVTASAMTGTGLENVRQGLAELVGRIEPAASGRIVRLPVDRSFSVKGFGTVVTGTLSGGSLSTGDTVILHPGSRPIRVRGLQVQGKSVTRAEAGERTAVNVAGIEHTEIRRGDVLTASNRVEPSRRLAVALDWLPEQAAHSGRERFLVHLGAAEVSAHLKIWKTDAEDSRFAQLWLAKPVMAFPGDRLILRRPSPADTVAGGTVIDPFPPKRSKALEAVGRLLQLLDCSLGERIQILVEESPAGLLFADLERLCGRPTAEIRQLAEKNGGLLVHAGLPKQKVISKRWIRERQSKLVTWLSVFHKQNPSKAAAPIAAARLGLSEEAARFVFESLPLVQVNGDGVSLKSHHPQVSDAEAAALHKIERRFQLGGFAPPGVDEVLKETAADSRKARALLEQLIKQARLVRISESLVFHADVIAHIRTSLAAHKGRRFTVAEFKEWTQISRKFAIPLLEYLDRASVTRRDGDYRVVL